MLIRKEFEFVHCYNLVEDNITLDELLNKKRAISEDGKIYFEGKEYQVLNVLLKEDSPQDYKIIVEVTDESPVR